MIIIRKTAYYSRTKIVNSKNSEESWENFKGIYEIFKLLLMDSRMLKTSRFCWILFFPKLSLDLWDLKLFLKNLWINLHPRFWCCFQRAKIWILFCKEINLLILLPVSQKSSCFSKKILKYLICVVKF